MHSFKKANGQITGARKGIAFDLSVFLHLLCLYSGYLSRYLSRQLIP